MQRLLGVLEEDVRVIARLVEVEEAEVEGGGAGEVLGRGGLGGQAVRGGEAQPSGFVCHEDGDARDQQCVRQAVNDGGEQGVEIGFGTEAAAELDESLAIVVALAVEGAIDPALNAALEGIEDGRRDEDGDDQGPLAHLAHGLGQAGVDDLGDERDDAEVAAEQEAGGEGVGYAALEDQVRVHQAVAHDGPCEGERQKDEREPGQLGEQAGHGHVKEEGNGVEQREGQHRQQSAAGEPLQLLTEQWRAGAAVAVEEEHGSEHVEGSVVAGAHLVEAMLELAGRFPEVERVDPEAEEQDARRVDDGQEQAADAANALLREAEGEVQEERGLQRLGHHVEPEDGSCRACPTRRCI